MSFSSFSKFLIRIFGLFPFSVNLSVNHSVNAHNVEVKRGEPDFVTWMVNKLELLENTGTLSIKWIFKNSETMTTLTLSFQTLEYWPYLSKHCNSYLFCQNIGILILSFQTLEFSPSLFKPWNSNLIFLNIKNLTLSAQTLEFWPYLSKLWKSYFICPDIGILTLSFQTLEF